MPRNPFLRAGAVVLLVLGFSVVFRYGPDGAVIVLMAWLPLVYALANLCSGRKQFIDRLQGTPLSLLVSSPRAYEHGFGWGRTFEWDEVLVEHHALQSYVRDEIYHLEIGTGRGWFSSDAEGQWLEWAIGGLGNIIEVSGSTLGHLAYDCREYLKARLRFWIYFTAGWIGIASFSALPLTLQTNLIALSVAIFVLVIWIGRPRWSNPDNTENREFLCPEHLFHVYSYFPGDRQTPALYYCVCGKNVIARDCAPEAANTSA